METERKELLKMCGGKKYSVIYADPAWTYPDWNLKQNLNGDFQVQLLIKKEAHQGTIKQ